MGWRETLLTVPGLSPTTFILIGVQIPHLLKAGYRIITPDLRGALGGESDLPQEPEAYHIEKHIVKDVAGVPHCAPVHAACYMLHAVSQHA